MASSSASSECTGISDDNGSGIVNSKPESSGKTSISPSYEQDPYKGATEYLDKSNILYIMQTLTESIAKHRPDDPLGFMIQALEKKEVSADRS